ncbi:HlyD family secretion protein [Actinoplanes sp. L3-i22]|uniref:HlyD family secretion protein n=1 Tax=Actinoplanes sp. L3-i22 TaxID=2836373 RepID=UPI001C795951|nr:HlyD family secretion protein [Actinoplanes sp. L3-i22]BCY05387.1 peptidoglycan-binding protein [Actinoplanes sp. L3-i22]
MAIKAALAIAAVALVAAGATFAVRGRRPAPPAPLADPTTNTIEVRKMDLTDERTVAGTLGFGPARVVKGTGAGVLTKLPAVGTKTRRGKELYRVNDQPVVVLYGGTPLFRPIDKAGLTGSDVLEVRHNLTALGYPARATHPEVSDAGLLAALKRWRKEHDLPGPTLGPGQAVILSGPSRVSELSAQVGDPVEGPLLSTTATEAAVSVPMSPADAATVHTGAKVTVVAPSGTESAARITAVARAVTDGDAGAKVTVTITPDKPISAYDAAAVQVRITTLARKGVLAVPVGALVALAEGGYALQRPDGSLVAAETGVFAGGMVQVSGPGVTAGLPVVTTP